MLRGRRSARTKYRINVRLQVHRLIVRGANVRTLVVRAKVHVRTGDALDTLNVRVDDRAAEEVEVEVVLCEEFLSTTLSTALMLPIREWPYLVIACDQ